MSENQGLIEALEPVAQIFQALDIRFFVGSAADHDYLQRNANNLNVADLLQKLMRQLS